MEEIFLPCSPPGTKKRYILTANANVAVDKPRIVRYLTYGQLLFLRTALLTDCLYLKVAPETHSVRVLVDVMDAVEC